MSDHTNSITWYEIHLEVADGRLPDADMEILIYDEVLDDVVIGHLGDVGSGIPWIDSATGQPLPLPRSWAEKPFPAGV